ncbi:hypothetical protein [Pseudomonas alabamensis]|uniref:hypothetical protein n=1 Tax=Pseudomonas alabamensis TaxID=3064349 RepID=UPI003F64DF1B
MPTENRSSSNHGARAFTLDSLTAALEQVQAFHEISADLIAESIFSQPAQHGQGSPILLPEGCMLVERSIWTEQQVEAATACITSLKGVPTMNDRALAMAAIDAAQCTAPEISLADLLPAQQGQGEPVGALLIDEYFDNREVGEVDVQLDSEVCEQLAAKYPGQTLSLYTHADPAEAERLRTNLEMARRERNNYLGWCRDARGEAIKLRAQLDEAQALLNEVTGDVHFVIASDTRQRIAAHLSASAEPSAPAEIDERAEFEQACREAAIARGRELDPEALRRRADGSHVNPMTECGWWGWQARAALKRKP